MPEQGREVHYNPAQLRCMLQYPKKLIGIMGRGTGKSTAIIAPRMLNCMVKMPYSNNGLIARTYKQIKTRTLPAILGGWRILGFEPDIHYVIGRKADKKMMFKLPDATPTDWEHTIHFFNGSIISLSSQDRKSDANGLSLQSLHADEAKMLDYEDVMESVVPTLRGLAKYKNLVEYRMITFTSDMPTTPAGKWLLDAEDECDQEMVQLIYQYHVQMQKKRLQMEATESLSSKERLAYQLSGLEKKLARIQRRHTYFAEASSFENIDMLTPEYIRIQKRNLPDFIFETSIMNKRPKGLEIGKMFYPQINARHFYTSYNYNHLDSISYNYKSLDTIKQQAEDKDSCLGDGDVDPNRPLDLLIDWGGNINSMLVCQEHDEGNLYQYRYLKEFFAIQPEYIKHLIAKFVKYYEPHGEKIVNVYYDRNGNTRVANSDETYAQYAERLLRAAGWHVRLKSYEENPNHGDKFEFFTIALSGNEPKLPQIAINSANCPNLEIALYNAPCKRNGNDIIKDKSSERSTAIPQEQATHVTDAFDYGYYARYRSRIDGSLSSGLGIILGG